MAGQPFDKEAWIKDWYLQNVGRPAEDLGLAHWMGRQDLNSPGDLSAIMPWGVQGQGDQAVYDIKSIYPSANLTTQPSAIGWDQYRTAAGNEQAGMNKMPFVFSNYGALSTATPEQSHDMLYRNEDEMTAILDRVKKLMGGNASSLATGGQADETNTNTLPKDNEPRRIGNYQLGDKGVYERYR